MLFSQKSYRVFGASRTQFSFIRGFIARRNKKLWTTEKLKKIHKSFKNRSLNWGEVFFGKQEHESVTSRAMETEINRTTWEIEGNPEMNRRRSSRGSNSANESNPRKKIVDCYRKLVALLKFAMAEKSFVFRLGHCTISHAKLIRQIWRSNIIRNYISIQQITES